jgi:hypothetical protein
MTNDRSTMTSEFSSEPKVLIATLAREIPSHRTGRCLGPQAIWRWVCKGLRLADGRVVKLEAVRLAGRWYSSHGALQRFITAQQDDAQPAELPAPARSATKRQKASEKAAELLETAGL